MKESNIILVTSPNLNETNNNKLNVSTVNLNQPQITFFSFFNIKTKWIILILSALSGIGNLYCFDLPGAMKAIIKESFKDVSDDEFDGYISMMYSYYSIPNIIVPLISGTFVTKYGYKKTLIVFTFLIFIGQLVFMIGIINQNINLAYFGRVIFGLGGESFNTSQNMYINAWFSPRELALTFGMIGSVNRLTTFTTDVSSPKIATSYGITTALMVGLTISLFSFAIGIILYFVDETSSKIKESNTLKNQDLKENSTSKQFTFLESLFMLNKVVFLFRCIL